MQWKGQTACPRYVYQGNWPSIRLKPVQKVAFIPMCLLNEKQFTLIKHVFDLTALYQGRKAWERNQAVCDLISSQFFWLFQIRKKTASISQEESA